MLRTVFIRNGRVVAVGLPALALSEAYDLAVPDPLGVLQDGDPYVADLLAAKYSGCVVVPGTDATVSVYSPILPPNREAFTTAGVAININPTIASPYVYCLRDSQDTVAALRDYGLQHGVKVPDYSLCDKGQNTPLFARAGFQTLITKPVRTRTDLEAMPMGSVVLKPEISCGAAARGYSISPALYRIMPKLEALAALDTLGIFADPARLELERIVAQQVADGEGDNFDALILSGVINGAGTVWHFPPLILDTQFNEAGRNVQSTWSSDNDSDETRELQRKVEVLIAGNTNCFYQLQFLRSGGVWVPHDFQYRMTYYVDSGLEQTGYQQHKADILKFVFDQASDMPPLPASFALSGVQPRGRSITKQFAAGQSKAAAVTALEAM